MTGNEWNGLAPDDVVADERAVPDGSAFALLLTHDVDRPYKTYQSLYYALTDPERRRYHLSTALPGVNPYWQFGNLMALEEDLGVRSAFYFLDEQRLRDRPPREWVSVEGWNRYAGRYDLADPDIREVVAELDAGGWEVGLHGSFDSARHPARLRREKARVESAVGHPVRGTRQHYLNLTVPDTWRLHRDLGLDYDASLGTSDDHGFPHGYGVYRPFDDEFVVFPLTAMEQSLPDPGENFQKSWAVCESLLEEARANRAVMTVLWHPRQFSERDFPGHLRLYRDLIARAQELGAWVGSPGQLYEEMELEQVPGVRPAARE